MLAKESVKIPLHCSILLADLHVVFFCQDLWGFRKKRRVWNFFSGDYVSWRRRCSSQYLGMPWPFLQLMYYCIPDWLSLRAKQFHEIDKQKRKRERERERESERERELSLLKKIGETQLISTSTQGTNCWTKNVHLGLSRRSNLLYGSTYPWQVLRGRGQSECWKIQQVWQNRASSWLC